VTLANYAAINLVIILLVLDGIVFLFKFVLLRVEGIYYLLLLIAAD